jgi:hypothetical protein
LSSRSDCEPGRLSDALEQHVDEWRHRGSLRQHEHAAEKPHDHHDREQPEFLSYPQETREFSQERTPGVLRVLMLGDSFTEGWGVAFEDTFSKRIEKLFAARGTAVEAINAGVGNYNTVMEVNYFLAEGWKYHPDIVVLNYVPNDAEAIPLHAAPNSLTASCYACVFLLGRTDVLLREASVRPDWKAYYRGLYGGDASGWRDAKAAIAALDVVQRIFSK